jgi:methylmalonyl-CoA mutase cobalamin-binding subunit
MTEFQKWNSSLRKGGFEVITTKVAQEQVANFVNENNVDVVLVRSATKVRKDIIDACPGLKLLVGVEWIILTWIMLKAKELP